MKSAERACGMRGIARRSSAMRVVRPVRRDIVKEEELLTGGVMPHERTVAQRESFFTCRTGITRHGHTVANDGLKVQPLGREGARIMQCYRCGTYG